MADKKKRPKKDEPAGPGEWIVTFSDCMTLLLCFFVMLLTFSSFDKESLMRFGGAFSYDQIRPGIEEEIVRADGIVEPLTEMMDRTPDGSETPTDKKQKDQAGHRPESCWLPEEEAYCDRKIIHIPSWRLFEGGSNDLSGHGRGTLNLIAEFLGEMPCRVVVSESTPRRIIAGRVIGRRGGLNYAWAVVEYLTASAGGGLSREQFSVSAFQQAPVPRSQGGGVVEVVMLSGSAHL